MRTVPGMMFIVAGLCACSASTTEPAAADLQRVQAARPRDAQLAERYERSCMACHAVQGSGAPLTGFAPHWNSRLAKGMDQLLKHTAEGFNAMPARGQCNDCSPDDLRALTQFMSAAQ
ncbi:MAG: c-type cytochrome [Pseudomonadota bacterium]